jgi:hypothetical protein
MKNVVLVFLLIFFIGCGGSDTGEYSSGEENNVTVEQNSSEVLNSLNTLRENAGMIKLNENDKLDKAAYNHAFYLYINNITGHYEDEDKEGYTGYSPVDRAVYTGYLSKYILENVSSGQTDYNASIESLFSAIYHRFGFLNFSIDNVGIGIEQKDYVYDMGNSNLNSLCGGESYDGGGSYYIDVCADESLKIYAGDYDNAVNDIKKQNPSVIIWPYTNAAGIPPVFYNEDPDPLPDYNVSGYPVSIQFNDYYFTGEVNVTSFKLYDENGTEITNVRLMDKNSDPNEEFSAYEFALFPLDRLEWNETYKAEIQYTYDGNDYSVSWQFTTKALPYPYYKISTSDETIYVENAKTYAYYFVPADGNDLIHSYRYTYPSGDSVETGMIDYNTVWVKVTGNSGDEFDFEMDNGDKLTLIIK